MMKVKVFVAVLLLIGVGAWLQRDPLTQADIARAEPAAVIEANNGAFTARGVIVRYQSADIPVYYLLYETQSHKFLRKELRFTSDRGCNSQAGDLPCVYAGNPNVPPISVGTYVEVRGTVDAQRIVVESIEPSTDTKGNFEFLDSSDSRIRVTEIDGDGGCEVFVGCFTDGIPLVHFSYSVLGDAGSGILVPGMVKELPQGMLVLLWASDTEDSAVFVLAHGKDR